VFAGVELLVVFIERVIREVHVGVVETLGGVVLLTGQAHQAVVVQENSHWANH